MAETIAACRFSRPASVTKSVAFPPDSDRARSLSNLFRCHVNRIQAA
jgi:hypothetical protein